MGVIKEILSVNYVETFEVQLRLRPLMKIRMVS